MYDEVLYEVDDPVATVTLNRPDRLNAFTGKMGREVREVQLVQTGAIDLPLRPS